MAKKNKFWINAKRLLTWMQHLSEQILNQCKKISYLNATFIRTNFESMQKGFLLECNIYQNKFWINAKRLLTWMRHLSEQKVLADVFALKPNLSTTKNELIFYFFLFYFFLENCVVSFRRKWQRNRMIFFLRKLE